MASEHWHLSRNVTLSTLLSIIILLMTQVYTYGQSQEKLSSLENQFKQASVSHVVKTELNQKLETQEYKIQNVADDVIEVKSTIKENQKMMIELLQRIPKKGD